MADIIIEKSNESFAQIHCDEEINHEINNLFSAFAPGYRFNPRYKHHLWDGKVRAYSAITQLLPIGLVDNLIKWCKKKNYSYKLQFFDDFKDDIDINDLEKDLDSYITGGLKIRDYQLNAVHAALTNKKGMLLSCTGSGKSLMIYSIFRYLLEKKKARRILLIVPSTMLVEQMYTDFTDYGWKDIELDVEKLYSGQKPTYKSPVLISTWQSLDKQDKSFFEKYDAIVVDEAHQAKASVLSRIVKSAFNAEYKIGTTGTLPAELSDQLLINGVLGNVVFELKSKELIDRGYLSKMTIATIYLRYPTDFIKENKDRNYPEEVKMVEEYDNRNKVLNFVIDHTPATNNMLILVTHREHLDSIKKYLEKSYPDRKVSIINGSIKAKDREEIRVGLEEEDGTLLVATYKTMSTGVNIPKLHAVMLYSNSKSRIQVLQSIGRGLRKHNTKNKVIIYDIVDDLSYKTRTGKTKKNYCMQHYDERYAFYKEQEFPIVSHSIGV